MGMWDLIGELVSGGTTVLLTTQYLEEADRLADSIAVVDRGRVIAEGTADELKAQVGGDRIEVVVHDSADLARTVAALRTAGAAEPTVDPHTRRVSVAASGGARQLLEVVRDLDEQDVAIDDIALHRPTLDDVFLTLTGHAAEEEPLDEDVARVGPEA
jgi:ABC-2 type transport system ATP-binding protein